MGRHNRDRRKPQARRDKMGKVKKPRPSLPPVEKLVLPTGTCPTKKHRFTKEDAPLALKQAQQRRAATRSGRVEKRFYFCDRCSGYHLTSRENWEKR